jgi:hypothetical protein
MDNDSHPISMIEKLNELQDIVKYASSFDSDRNARWVRCSHTLGAFDAFMVITAQGLGKLDAKLIIEDECITNHQKPCNPFGDLSDHITLSYLWVLGAYEVIRAIYQRAREENTFFPAYKNDIHQLKLEFERIRIPLAKYEAAKRFSETDSHIAYPGVHQDLGISWQLSADTWVNRRTLSDSMLSLFERMQQ